MLWVWLFCIFSNELGVLQQKGFSIVGNGHRELHNWYLCAQKKASGDLKYFKT